MSRYLDAIGGDFDPLDPSFVAEFWPVLAEMREECPALRSSAHGGFVALTRYEDIIRTAQSWREFSSETGAPPIPFDNKDFKLLPLEADPPRHRSLRSLLNPYFTPQAVAKYESQMRELTVELFDSFAERGACEFVSEFAAILPGRVVYEGVLGAPREDLQQVMGWVHTQIFEPNNSAEATQAFNEWTGRVLESRAAGDRRDDVLDCLVHGQIDGRGLTRTEQTQILINLVVGALDTTENALTNIAYHLATKPELAQRLREDGEALERAVDEFLRFEAPAPALGRTAVHDTEIHGEIICSGEHVLLHWAAGNRDPRQFEHPDTIDFDREQNNHLAFGWGPHNCVGKHVARLEIRIALEEMVHRLPDMRLAPGAEIQYRVALSRSPIALPIVFTPTSPEGSAPAI